MIQLVPPLRTGDQGLQGPLPLSFPLYEFKEQELFTSAGGDFDNPRKIILSVNPFLPTRKIYGFINILGSGPIFYGTTVRLLYKGTPLMEFPFSFGFAQYSGSQFSQSSLLSSGTIPAGAARLLTLTTPLLAGETSGSLAINGQCYVYPLAVQGQIDQVECNTGKHSGSQAGRIWLGCESTP